MHANLIGWRNVYKGAWPVSPTVPYIGSGTLKKHRDKYGHGPNGTPVSLLARAGDPILWYNPWPLQVAQATFGPDVCRLYISLRSYGNKFLYKGKQTVESRVIVMELDGRADLPSYTSFLTNVRLAIITGPWTVRISKSGITITYHYCIPINSTDMQAYHLLHMT